MRLLKKTGFDGFFTKFEDVDNYARLAKKYSMTYQSVHAPYNRARVIWHDEGEEGDKAVTDLTLPAAGHNYGTLINATPAGCETTGTVAHYTCSVCEKHFDTEKQELTDLADINRGTFYLYYRDVYDMLEMLEDGMFDALDNIAALHETDAARQEMEKHF